MRCLLRRAGAGERVEPDVERFQKRFGFGVDADAAGAFAEPLQDVDFFSEPLPINRLGGLHAFVLALSVAWQAHIQGAPHLYITAAIALAFKAILVPYVLRRMVLQMGLHREIETVGGIGLTMLAGIALVALSLQVMLPVTAHTDPVAREDIALALSVVHDLAYSWDDAEWMHEHPGRAGQQYDRVCRRHSDKYFFALFQRRKLRVRGLSYDSWGHGGRLRQFDP